ncbi:MAG: hypothetical protein ACR2LJ_05220 [Acidimicrobiales bacterium]
MLAEHAGAIVAANDDPQAAAESLRLLGRLDPTAQGDGSAIGMCRLGLRLHQEVGDLAGLSTCVEETATLFAQAGRHESAARLFGAAAHRGSGGRLRLRGVTLHGDPDGGSPTSWSGAVTGDEVLAISSAPSRTSSVLLETSSCHGGGAGDGSCGTTTERIGNPWRRDLARLAGHFDESFPAPSEPSARPRRRSGWPTA